MIPWVAILKHAPTILAAADALLVRARASAVDKTRGMTERIDALERQSRELAQLLQDIAQQIQALVVAQDLAARRTWICIGVAAAACLLAITAGILAVVW